LPRTRRLARLVHEIATVSTLNTFQDGLNLEPQTLRALLVEGDAQERVWAAWALGLKVGRGFTSEATARSRREPDPGVRRHLVVLLAGLGEGVAVRVMAACDPDAYVRATAYRYLLQLFGSDAVASIVSAATGDPSDIVREEAARMLEGRWPASQQHALISLLDDEKVGVRQAATDRLAEGTLPSEEMTVVIPRMIAEPDIDLQYRLLTIIVKSGGTTALAAKMSDLSVDRLTELLDLLQKADVRMAWNQLASIAARAVPALDRRVLQALPNAEEADLVWLARCAVRSLSWPQGRNRAEAEVAWDVRVTADLARKALVAKVAKVDPWPLARDERDLFVALIDALKTEEADLRAEQQDFMDDEDWDPAWLDQLADQRRRLERLIGRTEPDAQGRS